MGSRITVRSPTRSLRLIAPAVMLLLVCLASRSGAQGFRRARGSRVVVVGGYYYADPFWYGDPWYGLPYPWGPYGPYPYRGYHLDPGAAVRFDVTPKQAEVY